MRSTREPDGAGTFTERARREQILACAVEAIAELGYGRASLAEIARRAGVSKGVVSYYFPGKDRLLEQVVADVYARAGAAVAEATTGRTGTAALRGYLEANLGFLAGHPAGIRAVTEIVMNLRGSDGAPRFTPTGADPVLAHLEQLLRDGQRAGEFRDFDARSMAVLLRGAIDTASGRLVTDPGFDLAAYTRELVGTAELATRRTP
ncbi:TetR/AcrR family transcriptional regulator [Kocuria sp. M1N1S27]|uniref:TetR/AcrR family transcriptional regulator n=1 Tax=Kocuria kalidii TaxID=3376283 RepID=UPI00379CE9D2